MKSFQRFALPLLGVGVLALTASQAWAHCGKCAADCKEVVKQMDADVFVLVGDKVQVVEIGADGKAGKMEEAKGMTGMAAVVQAMDAAKVTMGAVIAAAEEKSKGKALAVTAAATGGKASYEVYALAGDKVQKVSLDNAGKATGMTEATGLPAAANEEKPKPKPGG